MLNNFPACLNFTLQMEGGWSNDIHDPGGCTMKGVTLAVYQNWKGDSSLTCDQLHVITAGEISSIYHDRYWAPVHGDDLPSGVDLAVWDMAVNAGVGGSAKLLQAAAGVPIDGGIGPQTLAAVEAIDPTTLVNNVCNRQADYYRSLSGFPYFGKGWLARVEQRRTAALNLISAPAMTVMASASQPVHPSDTPPDDFFSRVIAAI